MKAISFLCVFMVLCSNAVDPDIGLNMEDIAISKGYTSIEKHFVTTQDGYILGVYRIPHGRNETINFKPQSPKPVVFLQHGLLDSSWTWVANFPDESLGFLLADAGYDVWFGNSRGNFYSRAHKIYPVNSAEFWDFSWDDMAKYDLPAVLPYVLAVSGRKTLTYVGHSQGTIQALAGFSSNQSLASLVNLAVLLAPVEFNHHCSGLLPLLSDLNLDIIFQLFGVQEFLPDASILQKLAPEICQWFAWGCEDILFLMVGDSQNLNQSRIQVYISETPAGTSVKNLAHWSQGVRAEVFQMFDYGSSEANMQHYGQPTPPKYDLGNYRVPSALYHGGNDILADPLDVATLLGDLPQGVVVSSSFQLTFAHLDYTWGFDVVAKGVFADVINVIGKYNK